MNRDLKHILFTRINDLSHDLILNDQTRGEDTKEIGLLIAEAIATLKKCVNPIPPTAEEGMIVTESASDTAKTDIQDSENTGVSGD